MFVGCGKCLKVVDIENEKVVNTLVGHSNNILTIKTGIHPLYGECIFSQELYAGQIKLWINKTNKLKYIPLINRLSSNSIFFNKINN